MAVERYTSSRQKEWDNFVTQANNATFLFQRGYMEYHADRFADHSLMIYRDGQLAAILPANLAANGTLASHGGLTYGGLVLPSQAALTQVIGCFHAMLSYLHEHGISRLRYKRIPSHYTLRPDDDIAYCLFLLQARLYRRDCHLVVPLVNRLPVQKRRRRQANKARRASLRLVQEKQFLGFWQEVLTPRLASKYGVKPVHTAAEITLLASRFPQNIKQYCAYDGGEIAAGITIYETPTVAHAQYLATTEKGRQLGALDYLVEWLLKERYQDKRFFDFGGSNEEEGRALNHGLLEWKEGFGARCFAHDFYEIETGNHSKLDAVLAGKRPVELPDEGPEFTVAALLSA